MDCLGHEVINRANSLRDRLIDDGHWIGFTHYLVLTEEESDALDKLVWTKFDSGGKQCHTLCGFVVVRDAFDQD